MVIKVLKIKPEFKDPRGFITRVLDRKGLTIKSILYIERKKGVISANHYHKKDMHYIFCIKGRIKYSEMDTRDKKNSIGSVTIGNGEMVKSEPYFAHSTEFLEDTIFMTFSTQHRDQKLYEADTVRVDALK